MEQGNKGTREYGPPPDVAVDLLFIWAPHTVPLSGSVDWPPRELLRAAPRPERSVAARIVASTPLAPAATETPS